MFVLGLTDEGKQKIEKFKNWFKNLKNKTNFRFLGAIISVVVVMVLVRFTPVVQVIVANGRVTELTPEDIEQIIYHIIEILKYVLGYLFGRKLRDLFKI